MCVCVDSSFQINLPVWHTLCLTGEACHPRVPGTHFNIGETRWPLVHLAHSQAHPTTPPLLSSSSPTAPSLFHTLSFCHFHLSPTPFSYESPLSDIFFAALPPPLSLSLPPCHPKLSWSHYFEEKWSVEVRGGGCLLSLALIFPPFHSGSFLLLPFVG